MTRKLQITPTYLVCPECLELLTREDIEGFGHCPYCDHEFELNQELEDFLLRPVVQQWVRQARAQAGDDVSG
jgi:uncharacterized CHY-type Zn-finger protein